MLSFFQNYHIASEWCLNPQPTYQKSNTFTTELPNKPEQSRHCHHHIRQGWSAITTMSIILALLLLLLSGDVESNPGPPRRSIAGMTTALPIFSNSTTSKVTVENETTSTCLSFFSTCWSWLVLIYDINI